MECVKRLLVADASQEFRCHLVESFQNEPDMDVALQTSCEKFSYNLQKRNGA